MNAKRKRRRRERRGVLIQHHEGPFSLDAELVRREYGWTNAECWRVVDVVHRIMLKHDAPRRLAKKRRTRR
ncbi:MAG: hypothetical protein Q8Q14_10020 [Gemmatimonadales bacterium]|nr:hypothetical protein [Gemmatimonadales bacterium]